MIMYQIFYKNYLNMLKILIFEVKFSIKIYIFKIKLLNKISYENYYHIQIYNKNLNIKRYQTI